MSWSSGGGRVALTVNGSVFTNWLSLSLSRDLRDLTGKFQMTAYDAARAEDAMPGTSFGPMPSPIDRRQSCSIALDGETVLTGWIDSMEGQWNDAGLSLSIAGRDRTGDLADCAAAPNGPAEWRNATLLQVAQQVCAPFGIPVRADTDVGAPFARLALNPHESALSLLEKAARQRGVLLVSDGIGGLLLTTGGRTPAPADLSLGSNVQSASFSFDDTRRFSDIFVKGQSEKCAGWRGSSAPPMDHDYVPGAQPTITSVESHGILITGHATDPEVTRWRPHVRMVRTQSGSASGQQQAEWAVRVSRGESTGLRYTVLDWRANGVLWRPNTTVRVFDPYAGIDDTMLIRAVTYQIGPDGPQPTTPTTQIDVVGLTAFDRIDEPAAKRPLRAR